MKYHKLIAGLTAAVCLFSGFPVNAEGEETVEIKATQDDKNPIPDKYTTGASGALTKVGLGDTVSGVTFKASGTNDANTINFAYPVAPIPSSVVIENCDFSDYKLSILGDETVTDRDVHITFRNCRFGNVSKGAEDSRVYCEFENCSLQHFQGSNAGFLNCAIGGSYQDGMQIFRHVSLTNCYFSDFIYPCTTGEYHTDGVHIFGKANIPVTDLNFDHCRFEVPFNNLAGSDAYVNSCFMLSPEYSNASHITVKDCIMNGGGYTIYASDRDRDGTRWTVSDTSFVNVKVGDAHLYGDIYPTMRSAGATFTNLSDVDSLYIGYVGKNGDNTCFSVTNDTNVERTLRIVTDQGTFVSAIAACPGGRGLRNVTERLDFPTDQLVSVPVDANFAVCLDATDPDNLKQIRFVNYGSTPVYLTQDQLQGNEAYTVVEPGENSGAGINTSGNSQSGSSGSYTKPAHTHSFAWVTTEQPSVYRLGVECYRCEQCGLVKDSRSIDYTANILKTIRNTVAAAPQNGAVTIQTGGYISLDKVTAEALQIRNDVTVTFSFVYRKQKYEMTVPAGFDWVSTLNQEGWTGFLYIGSFPGVVVTPVQ